MSDTTPQSKQAPRAIVVGAGIAGLTLANRLDTHGWHVTVVERAPGPRPQGYMIDFFGPGHDAAAAMGLLPRIRELGHDVQEAVLVDERGRRRAAIAFEQFARSLDSGLVSLMRPDLERALREALPERVEMRFGTAPVRVADGADADTVRVELTSGETLDAELLAGADGIHSTVRGLVFGSERDYLRFLGFHTSAFQFRDARIHAATAGRFLMTDSLGAQLGLYALDDDRVAAFTVHRTADATLPGDARQAVRSACAGLDWVVPDVLELCPPGDEVYYDQVAQIEMDRWSQGRTVLLGDACQAVSLLAGQGASLAVGGAFVLAEELARSASVPEALHRYEQRWRPVVTERQRAARTGTSWFLPADPVRLWLRRLFLNIATLPGVGRLIATSLTGKPSRVVRDLVPAETPTPRGH
ncbi:FAD-dependent monooxygenase [Lipingzhangella sp. LS1_29]|uniref:FAD-dependent monooxygenase n=1 Tax=Lipingzhangella rawalii TaxID=2055835 RepID=A0ABU2H920_9ACTN|nr:FAD-dependent monooxygenase [Lipingzhangella rawalii]MDS1271791.1 FAD-dependent monooxygenase [Lipingzhangella rawalii]